MQKQMQPQEQAPAGDTITIPVAPATAAEPAPAAPAPASQNSRLFTEEDIEAARKQEKDKLYGKVDKLQQQLDLFNQEREAALKEAQERAEAEAQAIREREEAELSAKDLLTKKEDEWKSQLNSVQEEWEKKFNALQAESEAKEALLEAERKFQELESYKARRLQESSDEIAPQLIRFIKGNSEEEIEAAISDAITSTHLLWRKSRHRSRSDPGQSRQRVVPHRGHWRTQRSSRRSPQHRSLRCRPQSTHNIESVSWLRHPAASRIDNLVQTYSSEDTFNGPSRTSGWRNYRR
jgi:DNA polymerase III alpha subunit (gram-positive type)